MKSKDVVVIGAGHVGRKIASSLKNQSLSVTLIDIGPSSDDVLNQCLNQLTQQNPASLAATPDKSSFSEIITGPCHFIGGHDLETSAGTLRAQKFVLAMGSVPNTSPLDALTKEKKSASLSIIGDGPLGVSLASHFSKSGTSVSLFSKHDRILPRCEPEIATQVQRLLLKKGIAIKPSTSGDMKKEAVHVTGIRPRSEGFDLKKADVYVDPNGYVTINDEGRTASPWVWAAGSITGEAPTFLLEDYQADVVAKNINASFFSKTRIEVEPFPFFIPFDPPIATLGLTETEARKKSKNIHVSIVDEPWGVVKLVGNKKTGEILGVHLLGDGAADLILIFHLAVRAGLTFFELKESHYFLPHTNSRVILAAIEKF